MIAGRNVGAGGGCFGASQRQRQIAVAEPFAARALLEVQAVGRPQQPRAQLRNCILASRVFPIAPFAGPRSIGPLDEIRRHAAHDEFRRLGGILGITPPTEAALDVGVSVGRAFAFVLREHPRAGQTGLEPLAGVMPQQRPRGDIHREPGVERLGHLFIWHKEIAGHLALANSSSGNSRRRNEQENADEKRECFHARQNVMIRSDVSLVPILQFARIIFSVASAKALPISAKVLAQPR